MAAVKCSPAWVVQRARQSLKQKDPYEAKAWLITARTLFPKDFSVQYEAYSIEKSEQKIDNAAKLFFEMFQQFPDENLLWNEIFTITEALESNQLDPIGLFLKEMFASLPNYAQREMLLKIAARCKDCIEKCRMMLLLMRRFPDVIPKNGVTLTEMLMDAEVIEYPTSPLNPYRKLLVCDVLPQLLQNDDISVTMSPGTHEDEDSVVQAAGIPIAQVYHWLELAIQFYAFCATTPSGLVEPSSTSPQSPQSQSRAGTAREIMATVHEGHGPWGHLHNLICLAAEKCGWTEIVKIQDRLEPVSHKNIKDRWLCLSELHYKLKKASKHVVSPPESYPTSEAVEKSGVFYASNALFFQSVWEYCKTVNRIDVAANPMMGPMSPLVLVEIIHEQQSDGEQEMKSATKKKKKSAGTQEEGKQSASILISKGCGPISSGVQDNFIVSVETWHLLNTHSDYKNEFTRLLSVWNIDQWLWMDSFKVDRLIYKAKYKKVVEFLKEQKSFLEEDAMANHDLLVRASLQMSCCLFYVGEYVSACSEGLDCLQRFSEFSATQPSASENKLLRRSGSLVQPTASQELELSAHTSPLRRCLQLVHCTENEVLSFCVTLLVTSLKLRLDSEGRNDPLLGHVIVLVQHDWPKREKVFSEVIERVGKQGGLKYPNFFNYVIHIDVLEEFAHLNNEGILQLALQPKSTSTSRTRTVTRGVNKGAKEGLKAAIERQVSRSDENIDVVLRQFFKDERTTLLG